MSEIPTWKRLEHSCNTVTTLGKCLTVENLLVEVLGLVQSTSGCLLAVQNLKRWYETLGQEAVLPQVRTNQSTVPPVYSRQSTCVGARPGSVLGVETERNSL